MRDQQPVLARVIRGRRRRIAAVVRGQHQQVVRAEGGAQGRDRGVDLLQAAVEAHGVVAMAVGHVGLDEIDEREPVGAVARQRDRARQAVGVRARRVRLVDVLPGEDVADLADAGHARARRADAREVIRLRRQQREVVAVGRAAVGARLALERAGDHAPDGVLAGEQPARGAAGLVELLERHRRLVRGDLEDRVGGRVDDPLAGALVLLAQSLDDLGARRRHVADHAAPRGLRERVEQVLREAVWIGREGPRRHDPGHLPVADRGVLAERVLEQAAGDRGRRGRRRTALERQHVAETELLEVREVEPSDRVRDVAERVRAGVAERRRIGQLTRADGVEHHDERSPPHAREPIQARASGAREGGRARRPSAARRRRGGCRSRSWPRMRGRAAPARRAGRRRARADGSRTSGAARAA